MLEVMDEGVGYIRVNSVNIEKEGVESCAIDVSMTVVRK